MLPLRTAKALAIAAALLSLAGCLHRHRKPLVPPPAPAPTRGRGRHPGRPPSVPPSAVQGEEGIASWYGPGFNGKRTSNGEIYNMYAMTAAHRTLPFGTRVRVLDLENGRSVVVRINDRGPFVAGRIIDLSKAAAQVIHMDGTALVRLEILGLGQNANSGHSDGGNVPAANTAVGNAAGERVSSSSGKAAPENVTGGIYAVQVGAYSDEKNAERVKRQIERRFRPVTIDSIQSGGRTLHRVRVGSVSSIEEADRLAEELRAANLATETFVVRLN